MLELGRLRSFATLFFLCAGVLAARPLRAEPRPGPAKPTPDPSATHGTALGGANWYVTLSA
jgi:hypothetical protein